MQYYSDDGTLTDEHNTSNWIGMLLSAARKIGREPCPGPKFFERVKGAGFTNITEKVFKMPIGSWPKDPKLKELGLINASQVIDGLEAFSMRLMCDVQAWSEGEVQVLLAKVRKELKGTAFHAYVNL